MGGTFNPIHYGHIFVANYVMDYMNLDRIVFIPSGNPPHKNNEEVIDKNHRKKMVELAIKDNFKFYIDSIELEKEGYSYSYDTITYLKNNNPYDKFFYIIGQDAFLLIEQWYKYKKIINITHFLVVTRGMKLKARMQDIQKKHNINMTFIDTPIIEISSTQIRKRVKEKKTIKYFVNEDVEKYILQNSLYTHILN